MWRIWSSERQTTDQRTVHSPKQKTLKHTIFLEHRRTIQAHNSKWRTRTPYWTNQFTSHTIASSQPCTVGLASIAHKQSHATIAHNNRAHQSRTIEHNNATQQSHTTITHEQSHKTIAHNDQTWAHNTDNPIVHQPRTAQLESTQIAQQW